MLSMKTKVVAGAAALSLAVAATGAARAQDGNGKDGGKDLANRAPPTGAEFARLQGEVREQRQLIIQMLQTEQQRYDMLLRLIQGQSSGGLPPTAMPPAEAPSMAAGAPERAARPRAPELMRRTGVIEGRISGVQGDAWVYVENVKAAPARGRSIEIRQENKQFSPRVAVVQTGTTVQFPNMDAVYHNVFSTSAGNSFDLGSYRAGDKTRSVTLTAPGVVDVFCNMHQRMSASVLVVPGPLYAKVKADGSFRLENVPVGARRIVAWSPESRPVQHKVEVTPGAPATVALTLEQEGQKAHANKLGQPYGSYRD